MTASDTKAADTERDPDLSRLAVISAGLLALLAGAALVAWGCLSDVDRRPAYVGGVLVIAATVAILVLWAVWPAHWLTPPDSKRFLAARATLGAVIAVVIVAAGIGIPANALHRQFAGEHVQWTRDLSGELTVLGDRTLVRGRESAELIDTRSGRTIRSGIKQDLNGHWTRGGRHLFYVSLRGVVTAYSLSGGEQWTVNGKDVLSATSDTVVVGSCRSTCTVTGYDNQGRQRWARQHMNGVQLETRGGVIGLAHQLRYKYPIVPQMTVLPADDDYPARSFVVLDQSTGATTRTVKADGMLATGHEWVSVRKSGTMPDNEPAAGDPACVVETGTRTATTDRFAVACEHDPYVSSQVDVGTGILPGSLKTLTIGHTIVNLSNGKFMDPKGTGFNTFPSATYETGRSAWAYVAPSGSQLGSAVWINTRTDNVIGFGGRRIVTDDSPLINVGDDTLVVATTARRTNPMDSRTNEQQGLRSSNDSPYSRGDTKLVVRSLRTGSMTGKIRVHDYSNVIPVGDGSAIVSEHGKTRLVGNPLK